jgi:hypothetical protein
MTKKEFATGIVMLEDGHSGFMISDNKRTMNTWYELMCHLSVEEYIYCIQNHIRTVKFKPTVASLLEMIPKSDMTELEAWNMVAKAIKSSTYHSQEEWDKLPNDIQSQITPEELKRLAMTEDLNVEVVQSNFMRSYKQKVKTEQKQLGVIFTPKQIGE